MLRTLGLGLLALLSVVGPSQASGFTEKGLSLLSYQLCNYRVTQNVQKVVSFQSSSLTYTSCGGWIPWQRCPKTVYRTRYLTMEVPETRNVTDCCQGYEQLGLYCVLPLNHSREFASRPGVCPAAGLGLSTSPCTLDTDCPGLQKCCPSFRGHQCVDSAPPESLERNVTTSWYNVMVLVKMDFRELKHVDPQLLNHVRLLYSMITSALQPLDSTVHHLHSMRGDPSTTVSHLLLGVPRPLPLVNISVALDDIVRRVYEVIHVQVQDVNECLFSELNTCSGSEHCLNVEGSYQCLCAQESPTSSPLKPNSTCEDCPLIRNFVAFNVTSSGFHLSWSLNSTQNRTFHVQVYKGEELLRSARTSGMTLEVAGLKAGVLYRVMTSYPGCEANGPSSLVVRTDARVFEVIIRIINRNFTEKLLNRSSVEYKDFSRQLLQEVEKSFPPAVSDLYRSGKMRVEIISLQTGSVVVKLRLTVQDAEFPVHVSTLSPMIPSLFTSAVFQIDQQGTLVQDWDECADSLENDCSADAQCLNLEGSYTCRCQTDIDANPSRAGRACNSRNPLRTPTVDETLTSGLPPRRGDDSNIAEQNRTSMGNGVEEEVPSVPSDLATGQWRTDGLLDPTGELLQNSTTEPNTWLTPTVGPTGHIVWHPSPTVQDTSPAPLSTVWPGNLDPGPSNPADLPITSSPASPVTAVCGQVHIKRIIVSNVTSTSFHVAWEAGLTSHSVFLFTLTSLKNPTLDLEIQNTSVTLTGLEPGVIYTVVIVDKACGEESAKAHFKVRTVAQKLSGKVRIANVRYSESFLNESSKERQDFLEHFFRMVQDALPAPTLRLMDEGGIKMEITSISNGSVVVAFDLLIITDVDAQEVSSAFLTSFQNMSPLQVVRDDTFIQDYDECARGEDDCVPGALCHNTFGSFTCSCIGGDSDFWVEYSGRPCEDDSPANTAQAPASSLVPKLDHPPTEQPLTSPGSRAHLMSGANLTVQDPPGRMNLTGAVRVLCEIEKVTIAIQKRFLQQEAIPESSLYLGAPACNVSSSNSTHVLLAAGWSECGTNVQSNMTNTVVRTTLRNDLSPEGIIHYLKILSPIHCAFRNDLLTSSGYTPQWGVYTIIEDLHGAGNFVTEMQLFIGDSPIPQNYSVSASDDIKIEVGLYRQKSDLKVVLTECWATPSSNARDPVTFGFINNSCPIPNTYTSVIENGDSSKAQFKLKIFSFINNSIVYLHCKLRICMESPENTCKINCNDFRSQRSGETSAMHQTSWGPLIRSEDHSAGGQSSLGVVYVVLIVVAAFALVTGIAAILITRYQRMTGRYNFKVQSDNFSYQVFYE
ncbi:PREDICTED: uromodulin-like 1-like [Elephantulus edwardii]|uniref:uromodulin-like 1-like n=1 Tax=Elephantulus edwardii TaxID=28737 RepID=UPI0003F0964E|nr:PREDICTED: uromodulin-like 1-like [Elephantulus edwardii]